MTSQQVAEMRRLFDEALEVEPAQRAAWLAERASGEVLAEVERLLQGLAHATETLEKVEASLTSTPIGTLAGRRAGAYELLEPIGQGGMGTVYRAARADDAFRKLVAVKLLSLAWGGPEPERAFRKERQILANLEHPNIARLIDGGATEEGFLFIVMELVEGLPIDRFCAEHTLSLDARLALFVDVCAAVQHAHRNLIVHRDVKPSNIFITEGTSGQTSRLWRGEGADGISRGSGSAHIAADDSEVRQPRADPATADYDRYGRLLAWRCLTRIADGRCSPPTRLPEVVSATP